MSKGNRSALYVNLDFRHNYAKKIQEMMDQRAIPSFVGLGSLNIYHDDWCAIHRGGFCNCDPDIEVKEPHPGQGGA